MLWFVPILYRLDKDDARNLHSSNWVKLSWVELIGSHCGKKSVRILHTYNLMLFTSSASSSTFSYLFVRSVSLWQLFSLSAKRAKKLTWQKLFYTFLLPFSFRCLSLSVNLFLRVLFCAVCNKLKHYIKRAQGLSRAHTHKTPLISK